MAQEPDWKTISQAAMQQRDEANRNLCNLQIELAVMAEKLKKYEDEDGEAKDTVEATVVPAKKGNSTAHAS